MFYPIMENNICIDIDECCFEHTEVAFIMFMINRTTMRMDPQQFQDIMDWPPPTY
jgi:hypothetical protein